MNAIKQIILLVILLQTITLTAQDVHFSNISNTPLYANPALTGYMSKNYRLQIAHRNQWSSILKQFSYQSLYASFDFNLCMKFDYFSIGLNAVGDRAGRYGFTNVLPGLNIAYHKRMSSGLYLAAGASGGAIHYRIDPSSFTFAAQFDGYTYDPNMSNLEGFIGESNTELDLATGLMLYNVNQEWNVGFALHHLNQPKYSFLTEDEEVGNNLNMRFTLHGAYTFQNKRVNEPGPVTLRGLFMAQSLFGDNRQWQSQIGMGYRFRFNRKTEPINEFALGIAGRFAGHERGQAMTFDAVIGTVTYDIDFMALSLNYDVNVSKLAAASSFQGGVEVGLTFRFGGEKSECVRCPRF